MNRMASMLGGAAVAAAIVVGGGAALAAGSSNHAESVVAASPTTTPGAPGPHRGPHDVLDQALSELVANGTLTKAQAEAVQAQVEKDVAALPHDGDHHAGPDGDFGMIGRDLLGVAAKAIGITPDQLLTELKSGKSVAQVAQAHGVDPATVVNAVVAAADQKIDQAVTAGKLTASQASELKSRVADMAKRLVDAAPGSGEGGFGFRHGFGGHHPWGPPPSAPPTTA